MRVDVNHCFAMGCVDGPFSLTAVTLAMCCLILAGGGRAVRATEHDVRIEMAGSLLFPDEANGADGKPEPITGLSGLTWLRENSWAAAIDNSDRYATFRVTLSAAGEPLAVEDVQALPLGAKHDYEDVAPCPPELKARIERRFTSRGRAAPGECLLFCEEDTPAIRGVAIADGSLVGTVPLPALFKTRRPNRGPEALAVEPDGSRIWTANEEALSGDGPAATADAGTVVRLVEIPIPGPNNLEDGGVAHAASPAGSGRQFAYLVDPPHDFVKLANMPPLSGVVAIVALGNGRLLVLERSGGPGLPPFENRLYLVDTTAACDVATIERDLATQTDTFLRKRLLWKDSLGCNLEGLALGPALKDGTHVLAAIADNGGIGTPTRLVTFRLKK